MKRILAIASAAMISLGSTLAVAQPPPPPPPPAGPYEAVPPPPGERYVWLPGHWHWNGERYVWIRGRYVIREAGWGHYVQGHWAWRPGQGRWVWVPAHWAH